MAFAAIKWFSILVIILALQVITSSTLTPSTPKTTVTTKHPATSTVFTPTTKPGNGSVSSDGSNFNDQNIGPPSPPQNNKGLLKRMLYVAIGFSVIVALYFIVKTIRTKARKSKSKKYGMIYSSGDVEMQPLDKEDDEEDDMTVFDRKIRK